MRLLIATVAVSLPFVALAAAPPGPVPIQQGTQKCDKLEVRYAQPAARKPKANKLGELPPGDLRLAVHREVGGCLIPTIVRHNVGRR